MAKELLRSFVHSRITLQDRIDIIKECEKAIYDRTRLYLTKHQISPTGAFRQGIDLGRNTLRRKRKRLEALKKK